MRIAAITAGLPSRRITNGDFMALVREKLGGKISDADYRKVALKFDAFFSFSGSDTRYVCAPDERPINIALAAARDALAAADVDPSHVDLVIYTGVARGWLEPAMATVFQAELGLVNATGFDVTDACASWLRSMFVAKSFIDGRIYRRVMIINCEMMYRECLRNLELALTVGELPNLEPWYAGGTVGEAASVTLLTDDDDGDDFHFGFKTFGAAHDLCKLPLGNFKDFTPDGAFDRHIPGVFSTNSAELVSFTLGKLAEHYHGDPVLTGRDHDLLIAHAVAATISAEVANRFEVPVDIAYDTHALYGNTASATLPLALATAEHQGVLRRGTKVLLAMGASGVTSALCSFTY